jgi:pyrophosphatase PpaX
MKIKGIKAVICDWDDTITCSFENCYQLYGSFAKKHNLRDPNRDEVMSHWGKPLKKLLNSLWPHIEEETLDAQIKDYLKEINFANKPFPYSRETLHLLKERGYVLGVVSSGPITAIKHTIDTYLNIHNNTFHFVHGAEDVHTHKPDPEVFDKAFELLHELKIFESDSLYIGDNVHDYFAAKARGMNFAAVTSGYTPKESFLEAGLHENLVLETFEQVPTII